jgi:hypothetical protein
LRYSPVALAGLLFWVSTDGPAHNKQLHQIWAVSHQRFGIRVIAMNQEIDVSGASVLGTIGLAFLVMVPLVWAFVRYWLFAP